MRFLYTERFRRSYTDAPAAIQKRCDKQLAFLAEDLRHPSLRAKKYDAVRDIWQARVNDDWRFYFMIRGDLYYLIDIISHPK
jgi:mRNA interferase RelE/StbE